MMKTLLLFSILGIAACGGGGSKTPTTPPPTEPTPTETTTATTPTEATTPPAEPTPAEPPAPPAPDPKQVAMDAELAAFEQAKPVFEKFCKGCHQQGNRGATKKALGELDISAYPFTGKHANGPDMRKVLGLSGKKATMPKNKPGSVKGDDLATLTAWLDAWDAAEAAGAHAAADAEPATK